MTNAPVRRFGVGALLELDEADYMYGVGTLALRVEKVEADPAVYRRMEWINVVGVQLFPTGQTGPLRVVTIRVSALGKALRQEGWLPPVYPMPEPLPRTDRP